MDAVVKNAVSAEAVDPKAVAANCLLEADGIYENAKWLLRERILNQPSLRSALVDPFIESLCERLLSECRSTMRAAVVTPAARGTLGLVELARTWYDWPLRSGIKLGDATKDDLEDESAFYKQLRCTYGAREAFFKELARRCKKGEKARDALRISDIEELAKSAGVKREDE